MSTAVTIAGSVVAALGAILGGVVVAGHRPQRSEPIPVRVRPRRMRR